KSPSFDAKLSSAQHSRSSKNLSEWWLMCTTSAHSGPKQTMGPRTSVGVDLLLRRDLVPIGRLGAKQVMNKKVLEQSLAVDASSSVSASGNVKQVKLLVGLDQRVDHLQRRRWIDVCVHLSHHKQQLALQTICVIHIGRGSILQTKWPAHPLLVPPNLVHPVIVTTRVRYGDLVELRVEEQRSHGVLPTGRSPEDPDASDVVRGVLSRHSFMPQDTVSEAGVSEVFEGDIVKR